MNPVVAFSLLVSCVVALFGVLPVVQSQVTVIDPLVPAAGGGPSPQDVKKRCMCTLIAHDLTSKRTYHIDALYGDKVLLVKQKIAHTASGIPLESQQLIFGSTFLDDQRTLLECGLFNGAVVHVVTDTGGDLASILDVRFSTMPRCHSLAHASQYLEPLLEHLCICGGDGCSNLKNRCQPDSKGSS